MLNESITKVMRYC